MSRQVLIDGKRISMYEQEHQLFLILWHARGRWVSKDKMVDQLWLGARLPDGFHSCLQSVLCRLRRNLSGTKFSISCLRHTGWRLERYLEPRQFVKRKYTMRLTCKKAEFPVNSAIGDTVEIEERVRFEFKHPLDISPPRINRTSWIIIEETTDEFVLKLVKGLPNARHP